MNLIGGRGGETNMGFVEGLYINASQSEESPSLVSREKSPGSRPSRRSASRRLPSSRRQLHIEKDIR